MFCTEAGTNTSTAHQHARQDNNCFLNEHYNPKRQDLVKWKLLSVHNVMQVSKEAWLPGVICSLVRSTISSMSVMISLLNYLT